MGHGPSATDSGEDLQRAFQSELDRLAAGASRNSIVEAVMRLRALGEIAEALSTEALLDLAVRVEAEHHKPADGAGAR
jgi:hypothetical protein